MKSSTQFSVDTIVAVSTPRAFSGIGIVRLSGPDALTILNLIFRTAKSSTFPDREMVRGRVVDDRTGEVIDDGFAVVMRSPNSYTGEDVVELNLHGSPSILESVVRLAISHGSRLAGRGEFTRRAFLSGKLDLVQAEAVIDVIEASGPAAVREARSRIEKNLSEKIGKISSALKASAAELEAFIDFDEDDEMERPDPIHDLKSVCAMIRELQSGAEAARAAREGAATIIVGKPNVGKSTLFNRLLNTERTIVTPFPGTTRDPVDEYLIMDGISFRLCDTAGIRTMPDPIEKEGIRRTMQRMDAADVLIAVIDGSRPPDAEDAKILDPDSSVPIIAVLNKSDLGSAISTQADLFNIPSVIDVIPLSAVTGEGMPLLEQALVRFGNNLMQSGAGTGINQRCLLLLQSAEQRLNELIVAAESGAPVGPEIIALEIETSLGYLEEITGDRVDEEILDQIFRRFCIGK